MENVQALIEVYNTGFLVCAVVAAMALAVALILFFRFDIRTNFAIRTGRAEKITVKKLQGKNGKTDSLRQVDMDFTTDELPPAEKTAAADGGLTAPLEAPEKPGWEQPGAARQNAAGVRFEITEHTVILHTEEAI